MAVTQKLSRHLSCRFCNRHKPRNAEKDKLRVYLRISGTKNYSHSVASLLEASQFPHSAVFLSVYRLDCNVHSRLLGTPLALQMHSIPKRPDGRESRHHPRISVSSEVHCLETHYPLPDKLLIPMQDTGMFHILGTDNDERVTQLSI